ncbi:MAG: thioredoxin [Clostridia bacterium]|nr:MAG: thioredoxin [Clostridia bacterium]
MAVMQVSRETFDEQVRNAAKPVLLDFWASWCGPCRMVSPLVDEISEERDDILVGKVNVDEEPELAQMFNIMSIPTLLVFKNGEISASSVGAMPKEDILALLDK